eukprot:gnl/MRDRNA2_/MRDRNA2_79733_c0_seq2.p1 gnl/MRDRNA2_/MRDRNA2_79733_c0~~gnl/MRDRNA2_/MRDRNA2_79733_c0_seq2.p1  ORF type:complete len:554 (-),score=97.69 gnl/MRDRNA2_/MRDRNA2_79733_c0_seq2:346-2007(-)
MDVEVPEHHKTDLFGPEITRNKDLARQIFSSWDLNHDGVVSHEEFETVLRRLDPSFSQDELDIIFSEADKNNHGYINLDEFLDWAYHHVDHSGDHMTADTIPEDTTPDTATKGNHDVHKKAKDSKKTKGGHNQVPHFAAPTRQSESKHIEKFEKAETSPVSGSAKENTDNSPVRGSVNGQMAALHAVSKLKHHDHGPSPRSSVTADTHNHPTAERSSVKAPTDTHNHHRPSTSAASKKTDAHHDGKATGHSSAGLMLAANAAKKLHAHPHQVLHEEDLTTDKQLWEMICGLRSRMSMNDFSCIIQDAFEMGLLQCFPTSDAHMITLTPARAMTLAMKTADKSDSTVEELCNVALIVELDTLLSDVLPDERLGADSLTDIDMHIFLRFIQVLAEVMKVEKQVLVSFLVWVERRHFELADSQYDKLWNVVKAARPREHKDGVLRLDSSDVEVLMRSADVIQAEGFTAERCSHGFTKFLKHNEELMKARMEARPGHEISHHDHFTAHRHELRGGAALVGRTEMSVFLFELWNDASNHLQHRFQNPYSLAAALAACT